MLGPAKTRDLDRPVPIAIESYVPKDHFYRHLHRTLDLSFVRDLVADRYADGGRPLAGVLEADHRGYDLWNNRGHPGVGGR